MWKNFLAFMMAAWVLCACTTIQTEVHTDLVQKAEISSGSMRLVTQQGRQFSFNNQELKLEQERFEAFAQKYRPKITGSSLQAYVDATSHGFPRAEIEYWVFLNKALLSLEELTDLKQRYQGQEQAANQISVRFYAKNGYLRHFNGVAPMDNKYSLSQPLAMQIHDKSKKTTVIGDMLIIGFFPFIMMYGCATARCI